MNVPSEAKMTRYALDIIPSGMAGSAIALLFGFLQIQHVVENGTTSDKFGFPFAWRENLTVEICSGFDCVSSVRPIIHWPLLLLDIFFIVVVIYLALFSYRRLTKK